MTKRHRNPALMRSIHLSNPECQVTGGCRNITLDHLVPRARGEGADHPDNLMPIEGTLHTAKHGGVNNRRVRMMQRHVMTLRQLDYVIATKGEAWLDRSYPLPDVAALAELERLRREAP